MSQAMYNFKATNPQELTIQSGQMVIVAPREVQQTQKLLNTGWALATIDKQRSGLVPINYLRRIVTNNNAMPSSLPTTPLKSNSNREQIVTDTNVVTADEEILPQNINIDDFDGQQYCQTDDENKIPDLSTKDL